MIYCLVPSDLASQLHQELRHFYRFRTDVEVVIERRHGNRRANGVLREDEGPDAEPDRRRRVRRRSRGYGASAESVNLPLPRHAEPWASRIHFTLVAEPVRAHPEDRDTALLVRSAQAGDSRAAERLYLRYYDRIYTIALMLLRGDHHEAEDVTQDVFARALRALPRFQPSGVPFGRWLALVARNCAIDRLRRRGAIPEDPEDTLARRDLSAMPSVPCADIALLDRHALKLAGSLPLRQQQVLFLRYVADMTQEQTARVLGRSPDAIRKLESRAKKGLAGRLGYEIKVSGSTAVHPLKD